MLHELIVQQDPFPVLILLVSREDERVEFVLDGLIRIELRGHSAPIWAVGHQYNTPHPPYTDQNNEKN